MNKSPKLRTALVAVSGSLAAIPAAALELGDVKVHSALGQPLRASISYALAPYEQLNDTCVSILPGPTSSGLPSIRSGSLIVADGVIAITGSAVMREPLASMRVAIRCPYTAQLTRDYMLFIDPSEPAAAPVAQQAQSAATNEASRPASAPRPVVRTPASAASREPVAAASRYRVQPGDSLSEIAQRIDNRPVALWTAAKAIFAANPDAFIDGDMNRLKAGTWLIIPDFGPGEAQTVRPAPAAEPVPAESPAMPAATAYAPEDLAEPAAPADVEPVSIIDPAFSAAEPAAEVSETTGSSDAAEAGADDLQPGDIVTLPIEAVAEESIVVPDTELEGPVTASAQPNGSTAIIRPPTETGAGSTNWLTRFVASRRGSSCRCA